jgi:Fic family protein
MINIETFTSGTLVKHKTGYEYFLPKKINQPWNWQDPKINNLLEKAAIKLGELNSFARLVPNIDLFIKLHTNTEAVISSRIEGTKTAIDESFLEESQVDESRRDDWQEVKNYINAINTAIEKLDKLPISSRLIKECHNTLLTKVRGQNKMPGEYRQSQNWIGGNSPSNAYFVPPAAEYVNELMSDLENFIHNDSLNVPDLIKIAIIHYQFETIHPFLDGNGRIGRLLITLFLQDKKILTKPLLYLSAYFEKDKNSYYDNLTRVRVKNDLGEFIKYFLTGIIQTSQRATDTLEKVINLKQNIEHQIHKNFGKKSGSANLLLNYIFQNPSFTVSDATKNIKPTYKVINAIVDDFVKAGILQEATGQERNRIFVFKDYLNLFE